MYHYIKDKDFLKRMRSLCSGIINQLVQRINNDSVMTVEAHLVGSGAKNLETQNEDNPVDLDYNLCVISTHEMDINDGREIKEYIRKQFNAVLDGEIVKTPPLRSQLKDGILPRATQPNSVLMLLSLPRERINGSG